VQALWGIHSALNFPDWLSFIGVAWLLKLYSRGQPALKGKQIKSRDAGSPKLAQQAFETWNFTVRSAILICWRFLCWERFPEARLGTVTGRGGQ